MLAAVANALQYLCVTKLIVGKKVQRYRNSAPRYTIKKMFSVKKFKKYVKLFTIARKIPLTILATVGHYF